MYGFEQNLLHGSTESSPDTPPPCNFALWSDGMDTDEVVSQFATSLAALLADAFEDLDDREAVPELIERLSEELRKASTEVHLIADR
jgi:hypothetical protein